MSFYISQRMDQSSTRSTAIRFRNADSATTTPAKLPKGGEFMKLIIEPIKVTPEKPHYIICMDFMHH